MRIRQAIWVLIAINLLGALSSPGSGIAYFAHLGGGLFGYLYLKNEQISIKLSSWQVNLGQERGSQGPFRKKLLTGDSGFRKSRSGPGPG